MSCSLLIESSMYVQGVTRKIIGEGDSVYFFGSESWSELIYSGKKIDNIFFRSDSIKLFLQALEMMQYIFCLDN